MHGHCAYTGDAFQAMAVIVPRTWYGTEIWYPGPIALSRKRIRGDFVPIYNDQIEKMQKVFNIAIGACLTVWKTNFLATL